MLAAHSNRMLANHQHVDANRQTCAILPFGLIKYFKLNVREEMILKMLHFLLIITAFFREYFSIFKNLYFFPQFFYRKLLLAKKQVQR